MAFNPLYMWKTNSFHRNPVFHIISVRGPLLIRRRWIERERLNKVSWITLQLTSKFIKSDLHLHVMRIWQTCLLTTRMKGAKFNYVAYCALNSTFRWAGISSAWTVLRAEKSRCAIFRSYARENFPHGINSYGCYYNILYVWKRNLCEFKLYWYCIKCSC